MIHIYFFESLQVYRMNLETIQRFMVTIIKYHHSNKVIEVKAILILSCLFYEFTLSFSVCSYPSLWYGIRIISSNLISVFYLRYQFSFPFSIINLSSLHCYSFVILLSFSPIVILTNITFFIACALSQVKLHIVIHTQQIILTKESYIPVFIFIIIF